MLLRSTATALALGFLLSSGALALDRSGALGPDGEIYLARVGSYGLLFPKGNSYPADNVVLALEVSRSGSAADRILVPGTEGREIESSPFVVFEETSKSVYLLWQTESYSVSRLLLRSFKDNSFGPPIEVTSGTFNSTMTAPQAAVTRDEYVVPSADGASTKAHRTLLHLIWWHESAAGNRVYYAPISLIEGIYDGWHPVYPLNDFDQSADDPAAAAEVLPQLYRSPRIQAGRNDHSVVVTFANERNGRLTTLDLSILPGEISSISGGIRSHIIDIGRKGSTGNVSSIAGRIRSHIIDIGRLHPRVLAFLADDIHAYILAVGSQYDDDPAGLAEAVSGYLTETAATLLENDNWGDSADAPVIFRLAQEGTEDSAAPHLQIRRAFSQPAPRTAPAPTTLFASKDGKKTLVAWDANNQVRYKESSVEGWSETLAVPLSAELTREQAYEFLAQRIRR